MSDDYFDFIILRAVRDTDECPGRKLCALLPRQLSLRHKSSATSLCKLQHRSTHKCKYGCGYIVFRTEGFCCNILQLTQFAKIYKFTNPEMFQESLRENKKIEEEVDMTKFMDEFLPLCFINSSRYSTFFGPNSLNIYLLGSPIKSNMFGFIPIGLFTYIYAQSSSFLTSWKGLSKLCHYKRVPL